MEGKTVIVTGANTGIGLETARGLYAKGAHVILACRAEKAAKAAMDNIKTTPAPSSAGLEFMPLDLSSFASVRKFAADYKAQRRKLHVLVNNAGMNTFSIRKGAERTVDGFDATWQVNYLSHFLLTRLLTETLKQNAPSRIVNLSSVMHRWGKSDFVKYTPEASKTGSTENAYNDSKLAMALVSYELQRQLASDGVTVHAVNPGAVNSDIWRDLSMQSLRNTVFRMLFLRTSQGAVPSITAASMPELGDAKTRYLNPYWHPAGGGSLFSGNMKQRVDCDGWGGLLQIAVAPFDIISKYVGANEAIPAAKARDMHSARSLVSLSDEWVGTKSFESPSIK
mmetsp:Transcript_12675/g.21477  ORF Transcript_12675/g.21477 Transcript_12675/m.21477 type:complete len:338 (-) Transcript_12675:233-1246(-)|eukprot:CAMPEP_0198223896 /NCGR_PEP_ID=MMETSP1445-20131203/94536_1 /TAXON_ID=36898 /ORGANISM="Pyramimonas sp., Strain CCMP2087" /LENGTH=337 /DNA_ID=CAMNT_0043902889 /DNA_START=175 /DNA_END=1188 /DNA_ORIENTATION=+